MDRSLFPSALPVQEKLTKHGIFKFKTNPKIYKRYKIYIKLKNHDFYIMLTYIQHIFVSPVTDSQLDLQCLYREWRF